MTDFTKWTQEMWDVRGYQSNWTGKVLWDTGNKGSAGFVDVEGNINYLEKYRDTFRGMINKLAQAARPGAARVQFSVDEGWSFETVIHETLHTVNTASRKVTGGYHTKVHRFFEEGLTESYTKAVQRQLYDHFNVSPDPRAATIGWSYDPNVRLVQRLAGLLSDDMAAGGSANVTEHSVTTTVDRWKKLTDRPQALETMFKELASITRLSPAEWQEEFFKTLGYYGDAPIKARQEATLWKKVITNLNDRALAKQLREGAGEPWALFNFKERRAKETREYYDDLLGNTRTLDDLIVIIDTIDNDATLDIYERVGLYKRSEATLKYILEMEADPSVL